MIDQSLDSYSDSSTQKLLLLLKNLGVPQIVSDANGYLSNECYDSSTGTLSIQTLDLLGKATTDGDLSALGVVCHLIGNLTIKGSHSIRSMSNLENLASITGDLTILQTDVTHLNGLNLLERVTGNITIAQNSELLMINGFTCLQSAGAITIIQNPQLRIVNGFNSVLAIEQGELSIKQCSNLTSIGGFCQLNQVRNIDFNHLNITHIDFLRCLFKHQPEFKGHIKITQCQIASLEGFANLKHVNSSFYLHSNRLKNLQGLEQLKSVGASFSLGNNELADISQLGNLEEISGVLSLSKNRLTSLHGLEKLRSVKTALWNGVPLSLKLNDNKHSDGNISLKDISALANIREAKGELIIAVDPKSGFTGMPKNDSRFYSNQLSYCIYNIDESGNVQQTFVELASQDTSQIMPENICLKQTDIPFLTWEKSQSKLYEYIQNKTLAVEIPSQKHIATAMNFAAWLTNYFRISHFRVNMAYMKLYVAASNAFLYPDIFVTYSEEVTMQTKGYLTQAVLIVEVLSVTTQSMDRGEKFAIYRKIPFLREYVLLDPDTEHVEIFRKHGDQRWEFIELSAGTDLELESLEVSVPAKAIFNSYFAETEVSVE